MQDSFIFSLFEFGNYVTTTYKNKYVNPKLMHVKLANKL